MMTSRGELKQGLTKNPGLINYLSHGSTTILVVLKIAREFRLQNEHCAFGTTNPSRRLHLSVLLTINGYN